MMKTKYYKFLLIALLGAFAYGCTASFEEVNTDPDRSNSAPLTNILAYSLRYPSQNLCDPWNDMNEPSGYGGQIAKIQYIDEARYTFRTTVVQNKWHYINITVSNLKNIQSRCKKEDGTVLTNMLSVSQIWEAVMIQIATDTWRDIPYSEAYNIAGGFLAPAYDTQEKIYPALLALLKTAADGLASGATDELGAGDGLFEGDIVKWQKFCNSMRLRLALRISKVDPALAKSTVEEIMGNQTKYPILKDNADNAFFWWPGAKPYREPWFEDSTGRDDHGVSDILINILKGLSDPRLAVYAHPAESDGEYRGFEIGAPKVHSDIKELSRIGARFRDDAKGFSPYFRAAETWFHLAEAAKLGMNVGVSQEDAYVNGVTASLEENGLDAAAIAAYLAGGAHYDGTLEQLYLQEWISLFKQGMEVWSLYRRTGVPASHHIASGRTALYTSHNTPPFRYPYPVNETTLNGTSNAPFSAEVKDDFWGKQMWWDTRTGVN